MAKRYILHIKEIYKNRAKNWEFHYKQRETVKQIASTLDIQRILTIIQNYIPAPELLIDGSLLRGTPHKTGLQRAEDTLCWRYPQNELLCIWYWSTNYWQDFVKAFQALPDPIYEDYWYAYDAEIDALRFLPISQKTCGQPVDNLWISRGEVGQFPPKRRETAVLNGQK